jgi:hypothetical protein
VARVWTGRQQHFHQIKDNLTGVGMVGWSGMVGGGDLPGAQGVLSKGSHRVLTRLDPVGARMQYLLIETPVFLQQYW